MEKFIAISVAICFCFAAKAQDTIVKRDHQILLGSVIEIGDTAISYKNHEAVLSIPISQVYRIKYKNGSRETFNLPSKSKPDIHLQKKETHAAQNQAEDDLEFYVNRKPGYRSGIIPNLIKTVTFISIASVLFSGTNEGKVQIGCSNYGISIYSGSLNPKEKYKMNRSIYYFNHAGSYRPAFRR